LIIGSDTQDHDIEAHGSLTCVTTNGAQFGNGDTPNAEAKYVLVLVDVEGTYVQCMCKKEDERNVWAEKIHLASGPLADEDRQDIAIANLFLTLLADISSFERMYYCNQAMIWTRAFFLLVDPYRAHQILPEFVSALSYGFYFPCVNLMSVELLHVLGLRGRIYRFYLVMIAGQFITQVLMDGLRSWGVQPKWHFICQLYYDLWAALVFLTGTYLIKSTRFTGAAKSLGTIDLFLLTAAVIYALVPMGGPNKANTVGVTLFWRLMELGICVVYTVVYIRKTKGPMVTVTRAGSFAIERASSIVISRASSISRTASNMSAKSNQAHIAPEREERSEGS